MSRTIETLNHRAAGRQSYREGYTSTGGMPHAVYMDDTMRQEWLEGWAEADASPADRQEREDAIRRNIEMAR